MEITSFWPDILWGFTQYSFRNGGVMRNESPGNEIIACRKAFISKKCPVYDDFFFAINAFATLASYQFSSVVPKWIEYASFAVFTGSFAMFIYGFWLRSRYQLKHRFGFFTSIFTIDEHSFLPHLKYQLSGRPGCRQDCRAGKFSKIFTCRICDCCCVIILVNLYLIISETFI